MAVDGQMGGRADVRSGPWAHGPMGQQTQQMFPTTNKNKIAIISKKQTILKIKNGIFEFSVKYLGFMKILNLE